MNMTSPPSLTLISHKLCPYVQRAVIALAEKGAKYQRIDIDLNDKPEWFLTISPLGKTPVLRVDDTTVFESAVICEYLEDTLAPSLHPSEPLRRASHRAWIEYSSTVLNGIWSFYTSKEEVTFQTAARELVRKFEQIESYLADGPYFDGEVFSLVDAAFGPVFRYFDVFDSVSGVDVLATSPKVRAWRAALAVRPSIQHAVDSDYAERLAEFVKKCGGILGMRFAQAMTH